MGIAPGAIDLAEIKRRFSFHTADGPAIETMAAVRQAFVNLAMTLIDIPEGREKSLAYTHLEEAQFFANAAVVRALPMPDTTSPVAVELLAESTSPDPVVAEAPEPKAKPGKP